MSIMKFYYTEILLGGSDSNKATLRAEAARAGEMLRRVHEEWASAHPLTVVERAETMPCVAKRCNGTMLPIGPQEWKCQKCGSAVRTLF